MTYAIAFTVAATTTVALVTSRLLPPLLLRLGVLDMPGHRSSHTVPVARGGGLAPLAAIVVGLLVFVPTEAGRAHWTLIVVVAVVGAAGLLGWVEDARGVSAAKRGALHLAIGAAGVTALAAGRSTPWWLVALAAVGLAGYINVANFMDGINGISGMHGVAVGATLGALGLIETLPWLVVCGFVVAVAFAGFLTVNLGGRVFLGDTGSYALGAACAIAAIAAALDGVPVLSVLAPLTIYLADTGVTLARRVLRGERWAEAHREHTYQKLVDGGWSHLRCAFAVTLLTTCASALGLIHAVGPLGAVGLAVSLVGLAAVYLGLPGISSSAGRVVRAAKPART